MVFQKRSGWFPLSWLLFIHLPRFSLKFVLFATALFFSSLRLSAVAYTWNGGTSTAWANALNWTPNGIPGAADNITIVAGPNNPLYNGVAGVTNITMTSGILNLNGFTLSSSGTSVYNGGTINNGVINPTGTTATFAGTTFGAVVNANCGNINLNGSVFNNTSTFTKTNATGNIGAGGNTFNGVTTFNQNGTALLRTGNVNPDIFNNNLFINITTNGNVYLAENGVNTQFKGNIVFTNTSTGDVFFGNTAGTSSLANGKTLSLGGAGFSGGAIHFKGFTQSDATTPQTMTAFTGNATTVQFLTGNSFAGAVTITAGTILFDGSTFTGNTAFVKYGTNTDDCVGGNSFLGASNSFSTTPAADRWRMANANPDVFNNATFTHEGASNLIVARQTLGNIFNGTTTFNSNTAGGVYVCRANASANGNATFNGPVVINVQLTGNVTFAEGSVAFNNACTFNSSIQCNSSASSTGDIIFGLTNNNNSNTLNPGAAFIAGSILGATQVTLRHVTQLGGTAQNITLGGTGILNFGTAGDGNTFNGPVTITGPTLNFNSSILNGNLTATSSTNLVLLTNTFNGATNSFNKGGATLSTGSGANTFAAGTNNTITNSGTGGFRFSGAADIFNGNVTYVQAAGAGLLEPAYTNFSTYAGDISTIGTAVAINFGVGGGGAITNGAGAQAINGAAGQLPLFFNLTTNHSGLLTLNVPVTVRNTLTMTSGLVNLNSNVLMLGISVGTNGTIAYTSGWLYGGTFRRWFPTALNAIGTNAGIFPMGSTNIDYRPLWIASTANLTTGGTVDVIHNPVYATLAAGHFDASWGSTVTGVTASTWVVSTANGFAFNGATGLIRYGGTGFSPFVLAATDASLLASVVATFGPSTNVNTPLEANRTAVSTANLANTWRIGTIDMAASPLPVELISFTALKCNNQVCLNWSTATEKNNDHFDVERSVDAIDFQKIVSIPSKAVNGDSQSQLNYNATDETVDAGVYYYRLKQIDKDNTFTYSSLISVSFVKESNITFLVYPNPNKGEFTADISGIENNHEVQIRLKDEKGNVVYNSSFFIQDAGSSKLKIIPENKLAPGIYICTLTLEGIDHHVKMIIN